MKTSHQFLLLLVLCGFTFFSNLDQFAPDLMEARNFITAREMIQDGHWLSPTMNGEPRLEKPPLPTWLTAWSALVFGGLDNPYSMRIPAAASATLMVFFFFGFLRELSKEKYLPLLGAAIMATSLMVIQQGRTNSWDIHAHAFMLGSIWMLLRGWTKGGWLNFIGSGILMGLSILSKGPVPLFVLWLPFLVAYGIGYRNRVFKRFWTQHILVLALGLIIGFGWNIYILYELPEVMEAVMNKETTSWGARHVRPLYFYLHFPIYIGIWAVFVIASFFYKYAAPRVSMFGNYRFTIIWVLLSVFLLSVIPTKKERYLLPVMIPMALMATYMVYGLIKNFNEKRSAKWDRIILYTFAIIIGTAAIALPVGAIIHQSEYTPTISFYIVVTVIFLLGIHGLWLLKKMQAKKIVVNAMAIVALVSGGLTPQLAEVYYQNPDFKAISEIQAIDKLTPLNYVSDLNDKALFNDLGQINMKLVWAAGKKIDLIEISQLEKPFEVVLISSKNPSALLSADMLESLEIEDIGRYDYFHKKSKYKAFVNIIRSNEN